MLEDMAEFDYWNMNCSRNNHGWENNLNFEEPWFDTQSQETMGDLETLFAQSMVKIDKLLEGFKELNASISTIDAQNGNIQECHLEKPTPCEKYLELFHDDSISKEGAQNSVIDEQ